MHEGVQVIFSCFQLLFHNSLYDVAILLQVHRLCDECMYDGDGGAHLLLIMREICRKEIFKDFKIYFCLLLF